MQCTAPVQGHRSASAAARCPACSSRSYRRSYTAPTYQATQPRSSAPSSSSGGGRSSKRLTSKGTSVSFTPAEVRTLSPVHKQAVRISERYPDRRDVFLCHAWDDRQGAAKELHDELEKQSVTVWFSEKDVVLGKSLIREIDKGLRTSKIGIVLVTPSMFKSLDVEGIADKELSALLATDRVIPVTHETTFDELRDVSPLLAARSGLSTEASSLEEVAIKIAETIDTESDF